MLLRDSDAVFSLPLKGASDMLDIAQRGLSPDFDREKLLRQFKGAYELAPCFAQNYPLIERIVRCQDDNLFAYLQNSLRETCGDLLIKTEIVVSSSIPVDHSLKGQERVLAICEALGADTYINAIGGLELYDKATFRSNGVNLQFLKTLHFEYAQFRTPFVPWLSIVDILMFNPLDAVSSITRTNYELI